jgi:hypothetical protein
LVSPQTAQSVGQASPLAQLPSPQPTGQSWLQSARVSGISQVPLPHSTVPPPQSEGQVMKSKASQTPLHINDRQSAGQLASSPVSHWPSPQVPVAGTH